MRELVGRLAALDPDASAAVQVIAYFDRLAEGRAGLEATVRGVAVLAGCAARLIDEERGVFLRVLADGHRDDHPDDADSDDWPRKRSGDVVLVLEKLGSPSPVDLMVLERGVALARDVLDRTRGRAPDPALVELVVDASAGETARLHAAKRLRLGDRARAIALPDGVVLVEPHGEARHPLGSVRAGVGPFVPVGRLPKSYADAKVALRFADDVLGPRVVRFDELGGLAAVAAAIGPGAAPSPDVVTVGGLPAWALETLHAVVTSTSLRTAATHLTLHHSTLVDRLTRAEQLLGWEVRGPEGRFRLQLAFALRRLHAHPE
ncbi:PucR family transcriptional regulator [Herbidospora galbida]|uniref:PucR family transcriptional regulator n=1 Tax=Herbidospora galbida TaxID=2575442 RepID=A0A4U3MMI0_9ACTN|nr:helix-turn-helix domain-containing protein [Herbidospora galbida]TKK90721.1 PucR family transcriptional regulator [Herbidospora galbida]